MARSNPLSQPYPGGASKGSKWTTDTGYGLQVNQIFTAVLGVSGSLAAWALAVWGRKIAVQGRLGNVTSSTAVGVVSENQL